MSPRQLSTLTSIILVMATFTSVQAVKYLAINNATDSPGGTRFDNEVGVLCAEQTLQLAAEFIWQIFQQNESQRKNVKEVTMFVDEYDGVAYEENDQIHVGAAYLAKYVGDVRLELTGILYHESTHVWQYFANDKAPGELIEGIADYVRLKSGLAPSHWRKRGAGSKWDDGYDITAYFLEYCDGLEEGFVAEINRLMKDSYSDEFFVQLLGKTMDDLWKDYKAKYNSTTPS